MSFKKFAILTEIWITEYGQTDVLHWQGQHKTSNDLIAGNGSF